MIKRSRISRKEKKGDSNKMLAYDPTLTLDIVRLAKTLIKFDMLTLTG